MHRLGASAVRVFVRAAWSRQWLTFAVLVLLAVGVTLGALRFGATNVPLSAMTVPLIAAGLFVRWRLALLLVALVGAGVLIDTVVLGIDEVRIGSILTVLVTAGFALVLAYTREQIGAPGLRGEQMFLELREQLAKQGELPSLPAEWECDSRVSPADSGSFAGDFVVSFRRGDIVEYAIIDVSGKGLDAGTRALLLSGAFGGLLGAVPPEEFLPSANDYLLRQNWDEGFATAIHVTLNLSTGAYLVENAGHPPAIHYDAGSGMWNVSEASGVALGLLPQAAYSSEHGVLRRGDALLVYTDGLVEEAGRDLSVGIDKLAGAAEALIPRGFSGAADALLARIAEKGSDDRALVFLWRHGA